VSHLRASELGLLSGKTYYLRKLTIFVSVDAKTNAHAKDVAHAHFDLETEFGEEQSDAGANDRAKGGVLDFLELIYG
jgi:hypothetical protein